MRPCIVPSPLAPCMTRTSMPISQVGRRGMRTPRNDSMILPSTSDRTLLVARNSKFRVGDVGFRR